jgi:hypothetical protein
MLTNLQKENLIRLADNSLTLQALGVLFDEVVDEYYPQVEKIDNDEVLGQRFRSYEKAKEILKEIMTTIVSYKENKETNQTLDKSL